MRPRLSAIILVFAAAALAGCGDPGPTTNPGDVTVGESWVVSVCYPPLVTERDEIEAIATESCEAAGLKSPQLVYWKRSLIFNDCPLFKKMRASFECQAQGGADSKTPPPPTEPPVSP